MQAKIPALGQALAAASIPVVLTAAQITSLQTVTEANSAAIKADLDLITAYTKPYLLVNGFSGTGNGSAQTISLAGNRIEISNNPLNAAALTVGVNSKTVYVLPGESKIITTAAFSTFTVTCESNGTYTGLVESNA